MISVVIPMHNAEETMDESVESVLKQSWHDFELIAVENASTDKTYSKLKEWEKRDSRIRIVIEKNKGLLTALNKGVSEAKRPFLARMDADDLSLPERFSKQMDFFRKNPNIDLCGSQIEMFGFKKKITNFPLTHSGISVDMCFRNCIAHPTVMIRRERIGDFTYEDGFDISDDYIQWVRWLKKYQFANLDEPLVKYRVHKLQTTATGFDIVRSTEKAVMKEALKNWEIVVSDEELDIHTEFNRYIELKSQINFFMEARILNKLWEKQNCAICMESKSIINEHWHRLLKGKILTPFFRVCLYLNSPISDKPFFLWRKSRREKLKKILKGRF